MACRNCGSARLVETFRAYEEFESAGPAGDYWLAWVLNSAGAGALTAAIPAEVDHPGLVRMTTGTTATGQARLEQGPDSRRMGGGVTMHLSTLVRLNSINGGGQEYLFEWGVADIFASLPGACVLFGVDATSPNWQCIATDGVGISSVDTGVPIVAGEWRRLDITIAGNARAQFAIDGAFAATLERDLPTALQTLRAGYVIEKTLGLTPRTADLDFFSNEYLFAE